MYGDDRQTDAARWAIRQAELVLQGETGHRRAWPPRERRRLQRANLYLASARWKLARGDWRMAILLASKVQVSALRPPHRRPGAS